MIQQYCGSFSVRKLQQKMSSCYHCTFKTTSTVSRFLPQARTRGLFTEQKQMLWRMSRAVCLVSTCLLWARSVNISRAPRNFMIICWPSSSKEMFSSSWSHWDRSTAAELLLVLLLLTRGTGRDRKCCRKLLYKVEESDVTSLCHV